MINMSMELVSSAITGVAFDLATTSRFHVLELMLARGVPINLIFIGLAVAYTNRGSSRYSWDDLIVLRLTSRPIGA